ncbi:MAG: hypothetical protein AAF799_28555 [Myxococcota bacterium]
MLGCGDDGGGDATTEAATSDGGDATAATPADSGSGSQATDTGMVADSGSGTDSAEDTAVDPTDGVEPPAVDCGAGETLNSGIAIESDEDIAQLNGIAIVTGDFIVDSTNYSNLDFMSCLTEIHGNITIFNNQFLLDMSGTDNLTKIGRLPMATPTPTNPNGWDTGKGSISISNNPLLQNINGFNGIADIGEQGEPGDCPASPAGVECISRPSLIIRDNASAQSLSGFTALAFIFGSLSVSENDSLLNIDGLAALVGIGGFFAVRDNPSLCLSSVNAVGAALQFLGDEKHSTTSGNDDSC